MQKHTKIYLEHFDYSTYAPEEEFIPCEICCYEGRTTRCVDVHHIEPRGMGGSKTKDYIENLMGLCRECHNKCEAKKISKNKQKKIHLWFMQLSK